jgi:hypothetical protein
MYPSVTADTLHRTAKYFMDTGRADSHESAISLLHGFELHIKVGPEIARSRDHQIALLTLVNIARRTFLGGVYVEGAIKAPLLAPLSEDETIEQAVERLGGRLNEKPTMKCPVACIGTVADCCPSTFGWQLTWEGWRGGVVPLRERCRLTEKNSAGLAPAFAAAACASELFLFYSGDHRLAGRRGSGLSLWQPGADWLSSDDTEVLIEYLPSALWLIGLGNLGQAYLWSLSCLPYPKDIVAELMLQDFDQITISNDSTSVLTTKEMLGIMKTRAMLGWLGNKSFRVTLEERRFGEWSRRAPHEPAVALCGVDNALARMSLEEAGFDLIIETGLGSGTQGVRNFTLHAFPSSLNARELWSVGVGGSTPKVSDLPAYSSEKLSGLDRCGIVQLASRTIGVPFVGMAAASLAMSEILRRIHGGPALELISGSVAALEDVESSPAGPGCYPFGHVHIG